MKKLTSFIYILLSVLLFTSCDEYLDVKPQDKVIPETLDEFRGLLTRAYEKVPSDKAKMLVRSDEVKFNMNAMLNDISRFKDIFLWKDETPDKATMSFDWEGYYKVIFYANDVIEEGVHAIGGSSEEVDQLVGEAYLLRALMHFDLVNQYAKHFDAATAGTDRGVPVATSIDLEKVYEPSTVSEVYELIQSDLEMGLDLINIESQELGKNYRFSVQAAYAMQARVHLYMGDWKNAQKLALQVLEKNSKLEDLNSADCKLPNSFDSQESILALEEGVNSQVIKTVHVSDELVAAYDKDQDLRFAKYYQDNGGDYVVLKGGDDSYRCTFRTAEMYLIVAETAARLKDLDKAQDYLNRLKAKRLTPDFYAQEVTRVAGLKQPALVAEIMQERFRELAFEGHRWFDLRRTTQPEIVHTFGNETATLKKGDPRYTIRYPQEAIDNNPNLNN
jgi:hypothetical protein